MDCDFTSKCEETIRREPLAALGVAALTGLVVSKLPVFAIIGALLRLAFALVRPALVVFGILKVVELVRGKCSASAAAADSDPLS